MSTKKYTVFGDGGLRALINQTKANKTAAADNAAAVEGLTSDVQEMGEQITEVLGEVEGCLNELDSVKADTEAVNTALGAYVTKAQLEEILSMLNFGFVADESEMETPYTAVFAAVEALETRLEGDS